MNIIENKKRIAVIGSGTAGCISAIHSLRNPLKSNSTEIIWYTSPKIPAKSVGEGAFPILSSLLKECLDWGHDDIIKVKGTYKTGIKKKNWGGSGDFMHSFPIGTNALHFNANIFQETIKTQLSQEIPIIEKHINNPTEIDSDYIIDCSGTPKNFNEYYQSPYIPVNNAYITQCYWDSPTFDHTLTIARPYGWVFGIPLQNRCSIGYLFNNSINSLKEVKEDVKNIFKEYKLNPSESTNNIKFNNYYKKENFTDRIAYNGNASFFLEPMEATSITTVLRTNILATEIIHKNYSPDEQNQIYVDQLRQIECMIMFHYLAGSKFNTPFWEYALNRAENCISNPPNPKLFNQVYNLSKIYTKKNVNNNSPNHSLDYGLWPPQGFSQNLKNLNLYNKIDKLINT